MPEGFHPPIEEYLEAMLALEEEGTVVIQARLAERLGHAAPSVSEMVRRLHAEGLVEFEGRRLLLTPEGRERAERVVRKHRLAERLLTDVIGLAWHKAHLEAGRWEHVISDEVERRLVDLLGNPTTCPHGNPIPGSAARGHSPDGQIPLAAARPGDRVRLERVAEQVETDEDSLTRLERHGFLPGTDARVRARRADGTVVLELAEGTLSLSPAVSRQLYVAQV